MKQYDAIIIGFGKGGKLLAAELANRNWKWQSSNVLRRCTGEHV